MLAQLSSGKAESASLSGVSDAATVPLDTSLIHAYDAPLLPTPPVLESRAPCAPHDGLTSRASNLLCCFSSAAGYYTPQRDAADLEAGESASCSDGDTRELRVFDAAPCTRNLLARQAPEHSGRATLVLDLDGAPARVFCNAKHDVAVPASCPCALCACCSLGSVVPVPPEGAQASVCTARVAAGPRTARSSLTGHAHTETLVHSSFRPVANADFVLTVDVQGTVMHVYVMKRPWLDVFLQQAARNFEVVVFTASLGKYADAVLDHLDPLGTVSGRLYRESCVLHGGSYVKDLARIGRPLERTVLVDNAAHSFAFQPANGLHSSTFIGDRSDTGLLEMMAVLLRIKDSPDVRPALHGAVAACGYAPQPCLE